jgi:hypothetical protein
MVMSFFMALLADLVFDSAATMRRSFGSEMSRYLEQRGVRAARPTHTPPR